MTPMTPKLFDEYLAVANARGAQFFEIEDGNGGHIRCALGAAVPVRRDKGKGDDEGGIDEGILYGSAGGSR